MKLWIFISVLALATAIGIFITEDPGYALFAYGDWAIEMPLWVSAIVFIVAVTLVIVTLNIINTIFFSSRQVKLWWGKHQEQSARKKTHRGLIELAAGRWKNAEKYLIQSAAHSDTPLVNYLSAAKAAEEGDSPERRDRYLKLAFDVSAGSDVAVRLTQAQLQLEHGDLAQSIRNLERLREETPKNPKVLRLLCTLYEAMNDWQSLHALLPFIQKTHALTPTALERLEQKIYPPLLPFFGEKGLKSLMAFWQDSPLSIQSNPTVIAIYAKILVQKLAISEAENLLRQSLKKCWNSQLIYLYGTLITSHPKTQLSFVESFLSDHAGDPIVWLSAAKICLSSQLWGKARDYLEKSLSLAPLPETYALLGQLMEQLNLRQQSDQYYKQGLLAATQTTTDYL
jgi:HemY protein